jgi:hypothetical protein
MESEYNEEFSGVFMFTNPTDQERKYLWNNKEYTFPPQSTVPLIIPTETLENIRFYEGAEYKRMKEMGNGMPPTFDDKILEPMIEECLKPLPMSRASIKQASKIDDERNYKATKALEEGEDPNMLFAEENKNVQKFGKM